MRLNQKTMKAKFNLKQIATVALSVKRYGELYVTTEGVMFRTKRDAEEATRVRNMIFDDATEYVAIKKLSAEHFTKSALQSYAKSTENFDALFDDAYVPVAKGKRTVEKKDDDPAPLSKDAEDEILSVLNAATDAEAKPRGKKSSAKEQPENEGEKSETVKE